MEILKELSFCHKLRFSNSYNLANRFPRPLIFQTINSGSPNSLSLKYQRFTPSGCKDIGVRKCKFVAETQFLSLYFVFLSVRYSPPAPLGGGVDLYPGGTSWIQP